MDDQPIDGQLLESRSNDIAFCHCLNRNEDRRSDVSASDIAVTRRELCAQDLPDPDSALKGKRDSRNMSFCVAQTGSSLDELHD